MKVPNGILIAGRIIWVKVNLLILLVKVNVNCEGSVTVVGRYEVCYAPVPERDAS
jgi:hypothetical protein